MASYTATYDGVAYYFASAETKEAFEADPGRYLPMFGGFCAFGVSIGRKLNGDPRYADIYDGKLYLFVDADVLTLFRESQEDVVLRANWVWPSIQDEPTTNH